MNRRPIKATLAVAAVTATAALVPFVAHASSSAAACSTETQAVGVAQTKVDNDIDALARAESRAAHTKAAKRHKAAAVAAARKRLTQAQGALATAHDRLTTCQVDAKPTATVTATTTATATATATATVTAPGSVTTVTPSYTPAPLVWNQGTALLKETNPDGSAIAPLAYWDGVPISGTGFGSAWTEDPNNPGYFYGLTDRGPNVTAPDTSAKLEPLAGFQDAIGYFHEVDGTLQLVSRIGLTLAGGEPMGGLENTEADAGETILDQYGDTLPHAASGLDTEGLVALPDGTFWVSDEYGPFIVHFDATGKEIGRFDPYLSAPKSAADDTTFGSEEYPLPQELRRRKANKGMEGLTVTPDGKYLVGIMQSPLQKNSGGTGSASGTSASSGAITRIVKIALNADGTPDASTPVQEFLYSLHTNGQTSNPAGQAVSEITALPGDDDHFVVDERDGSFESTAGVDKNLWEIDLSGATDVGPSSSLIGTAETDGTVSYNPTSGLNVGTKSIEDIAGTKDDADAIAALHADGIETAAETLYLNYSGLVRHIDPTGAYFEHDKVEGVAVDAHNPNIVYLSNDSDFGLTDLPAGANPTAGNRAKGTDAKKTLPASGVQDFGEVMEVDMTQVPSAYKG